MSYRQANAGLVTHHNRNYNSGVRSSMYLLKVTNLVGGVRNFEVIGG
jgi:hypothetical protein